MEKEQTDKQRERARDIEEREGRTRHCVLPLRKREVCCFLRAAKKNATVDRCQLAPRCPYQTSWRSGCVFRHGHAAGPQALTGIFNPFCPFVSSRVALLSYVRRPPSLTCSSDQISWIVGSRSFFVYVSVEALAVNPGELLSLTTDQIFELTAVLL